MARVSTDKRTSDTAADTLAKKSRDDNVVSGGHLVAAALKNGGVDHPIFTSCCGGPWVISTSTRRRLHRPPVSRVGRPLRQKQVAAHPAKRISRQTAGTEVRGDHRRGPGFPMR